ncbi:zinc-binding alcohol dehydrogenase [Jiangella asiatica]|uniref:Zinc-binding alcohol dehydrogenase n=2 Tax=Jiangella asiatica TaxID=2530372 RepID=A0A4R5DQ83_9ACTN|nr:zinc-binding alcohol dehydrogenase [Jiangella asiatica]
MVVAEFGDVAPGPAETLVEVLATGICGSDIHGYTGENGRRRPGQVMGHETVGRVLEHGDAAAYSSLPAGTVVTLNPVVGCGACAACTRDAEQACPQRTVIGVAPDIPAAFAERMIAPTRNLVPLPEGAAWELGALVEPLAVGYHAARRGSCGPDDAVLVVGGGPIGQACVLAAWRLGASAVAVSETNDARRQLLDELGTVTIDPSAGELKRQAVSRLGRRPTLVIDAVGSEPTITAALEIADVGARVVLVGMAQPHIPLSAYRISTEERTLIGSFCYTSAEFRETAEWIATAPQPLDRLIEGRVDLAGAPDAFEALARGTAAASKVLVYPNGLTIGAA